MTKALIVVDVQNDYFPGGSMVLDGMDAAASNCGNLLTHFRNSGQPVFIIQHFSVREGATFFVPGTEGCRLHDTIVPQAGEALVEKNFPSAFRDTCLDQQLRDATVDELVICGAMTHMCIDTTVRAAFDLGYRNKVVSDACATRDLSFDDRVIPARDVHGAFMSALSVPFARVVDCDSFLAEAG